MNATTGTPTRVIPLRELQAARERIADAAIRTPLVRLNADASAEIYLKLENLQPIGSFKIRGASNRMALTPRSQLERGVWTASAGNMAQGVAWNAQRLGIPCTVVVPEGAPATKLAAVERMGARVARLNLSESGGEAVADLLVRPARLVGTEVAAAEIPTLVDEVPVLAVLASRARGETVFRDVGELRVKESNRLELIAANLRTLGGAAEARGNDLYVAGTPAPPRGRVDTAGDHRLAMAFAVLGTVPGGAVRLSERASVAISYPGFFSDLRRIQATGNRQRVT